MEYIKSLLAFTASEIRAIVFALLIGIGSSEFVKRVVRYLLRRRFNAELHYFISALIGFAMTAFICYRMWPSSNAFEVAVVIGVAAPLLYKLVTLFLRKIGKGDVADTISGNRGESQ